MNLMKFLKPVNAYAMSVNLLVIFAMVVILLTHKELPPKIPLWFSLDWGEQRLAQPVFLWILPLVVSFFFASSFVFGKVIGKRYPIIAQILVWTTAFLSFVFLLSVYKIILLVS